MSRRRRVKTSQAPKGKKRPRWYHHGETQGVANEIKRKKAMPAFERAERHEAEVEAMARTTRAEVADHRTMIDGLAHVSPALYAPASAVWSSW